MYILFTFCFYCFSQRIVNLKHHVLHLCSLFDNLAELGYSIPKLFSRNLNLIKLTLVYRFL